MEERFSFSEKVAEFFESRKMMKEPIKSRLGSTDDLQKNGATLHIHFRHQIEMTIVFVSDTMRPLMERAIMLQTGATTIARQRRDPD